MQPFHYLAPEKKKVVVELATTFGNTFIVVTSAFQHSYSGQFLELLGYQAP